MHSDRHIRLFDTKSLKSFQTESTSKGNQLKWMFEPENLYIKAQFYYQGKYWRDDLVEILATTIGQQLFYKQVEILDQHRCIIHDYGQEYYGVYSTNFCREGERFISFYRIMQLYNLEFPYNDSIEKKWDFVIETIKSVASIDYTEYLIIMTLTDYLSGNEDRHLSNFGLITNNTTFRLAPLFDFGLGLFEHDRKYEGLPFRECLKMMNFKPFHKEGDDVIHFLKSRYDLHKYLPDSIDLTGVELPSMKASSYLLNRSNRLNVVFKGIEI